jgi:hypothetical protein
MKKVLRSSPRADQFFNFCPFEDQIERLSVCRREVYAVGRTVHQRRFQQLAAFGVISRKVR